MSQHDIDPIETLRAELSRVEVSPDFAARVRSGRRVEPLYGAINLPNFFRKPYGPGWALVGDAGYHKDPYLAHGVSDALRDAEILSLAVHRGLAVETRRHAGVFRPSPRPPTQLATCSSAW